MSDPLLLPCVALAVVAAAAVTCAWSERRLRGATRAAAADLARLVEDRGRRLDLLTREMSGTGLALLGVAAALADPHRAALDGGARRLLRLCEDEAEARAGEAGPRRLKLERLPLRPLLEEAVATTASQLGAGRRQWRLSSEFDGVQLLADERALRGALLPVLARAARSSRDGDWIDIRPVATAAGFSIVIEDEGGGIGAEDLAAAVVPPGADQPMPERTRGLSHGLAVARSLLEAHGGALRLEALTGVGSRAWLTLPGDRLIEGGHRVDSAAAKVSSTAAARPGPAASTPRAA